MIVLDHQMQRLTVHTPYTQVKLEHVSTVVIAARHYNGSPKHIRHMLDDTQMQLTIELR